MIDEVLPLCASLIKCKSITPADDGALDVIADYLSNAGFDAKIRMFTSPDGKNSIRNLYAQYGRSDKRILGFLGHSDVVPAGDLWEVDPFGGVMKDGYIYGRGVCDMKGGIAAFCAAVTEFVKNHPNDLNGSIVIMITGDEEVGSYEGIQSLINWCREYGQLPHDCLIGEPSSYKEIGDRVYIGHRGSLNVTAKAKGQQGHVAYQGNYDNSLSKICRYVVKMLNYKWNHTDLRFPCTNIEPTMIFSDNYAVNVVPENTEVNLNIRYGADYTFDDLRTICYTAAEEYGIDLEFNHSGNAYCCDDDRLKSLLGGAIEEVVRKKTEFSCAGGTSDGRFMSEICNVIEFGLQDASIHQKNERAKVDDLVMLSKIYHAFLNRYFDERR